MANDSIAPTTPTLLGLDLGSSSLKALLLDLDGRVLAERSAAYPTRAPAPGWAEQDPDDWWAAAGEATRGALDDVAGADVVGIGLSGQMHTFVLLGVDGETVRPAVTWMDTRAAGLLPEVEATIEAAGLRGELANPVVLGLTLPPLVWLREREPETLARARTLLLAKDALRQRLTGELGSEPTDASATLAFDVAGRRWSSATLEAFGLDPTLMPALGEPDAVAGRLARDAARHLGLRAGIPVAFGAGDQQAAAVGTGTVLPGQAQLMVGTGAQALVVEAAPPTGEIAGLHAFCHARGWLRQASVNNAGVALDWARTLLGLSWDDLYGALGGAPPEAAPLFLPYLTGERAPLMKGHARGGWLGLEPGHGREALARAAVAGVVVAIADGLRALPGPDDRDGRVDRCVRAALRVRAGGGGLRNPAFAQAVADGSGTTLELLDASAASAVGAALLGGVACGAFADLDAAVARAPAAVAATVAPRPDRAAAWAALRERIHALDALGLHETVAGHRAARSSSSSVRRWPATDVVEATGREWAAAVAASDARVVAIGCFGPFARGDDGFGSDLDLIAIVDGPKPRPTAPAWSTAGLPVPADLLVYDVAEWHALIATGGRMARTLQREARWWVGAPPESGEPGRGA